MDLVNAQQARRALDYLVGFNLSPLLWKKIKRGLSAGRVQSPALRLICEREAEIDKFKSREYWTIEADLVAGKSSFVAKLSELNGEKVRQFTVTSEDQAADVREQMLDAATGELVVAKVERKKSKTPSGVAVHHVHLAAGRACANSVLPPNIRCVLHSSYMRASR